MALDQLVKGCQLAMHNAVLLAAENKQLRDENSRQKRKRAQKKKFIATRGVLTMQEGLDRSKPASRPTTRGIRVVGDQVTSGIIRTIRKCGICRSEAHTARTCAQRLAIN